MDRLDENVPHNDVEGGVLIVMEHREFGSSGPGPGELPTSRLYRRA
jgi:hypothetical protein